MMEAIGITLVLIFGSIMFVGCIRNLINDSVE